MSIHSLTGDFLHEEALRPYAGLTGHQLRARQHPEDGLFLAEGHVVIAHALDAGYRPVSFLVTGRQITGNARDILARCEDVPAYTGTEEQLTALTGYRIDRGMLACMRRKPLPAPGEILAGASRVAILEDIVDPTNVGALMRSAAALGMDAVLVTPSCCDPLHRRAVRVSMGTVFQVPWAQLGASPKDWPGRGIAVLKEAGFRTAALALDDRSLPIDDPRPAAEEKLALLLGTEGSGLRPDTIAACDYTLRIPMGHGVDSLNVGAAGAVAFWQLRRR